MEDWGSQLSSPHYDVVFSPSQDLEGDKKKKGLGLPRYVAVAPLHVV